MLSYQADAESAGWHDRFPHSPVVAAAIAGRKIELRTGGSEPAAELEADLAVNAAGLDVRLGFFSRPERARSQDDPTEISRQGQSLHAHRRRGAVSPLSSTRSRSPAVSVSI